MWNWPRDLRTAQQFGRIWSEANINHRAGWPPRVVPDAYPAWRPGHRHSSRGWGCETLDHYKLYIRLAAASARVHPTRFPCLSRRLARAKVAANAAFACCSARLIEAGVGWRSSCAPIDCGAIGPAFGLPADWRTACSNCAILLLHGPACATAALRPRRRQRAGSQKVG